MLEPQQQVVMRQTSTSTNNTIANKGFNQDDVNEYRAVFNFFDEKNSGKVTSKSLATTLRSLKLAPTERMVQKEVGRYVDGVNFEQFLDSLHVVIRATAKKNRRQSIYTIQISDERRNEMKDAFDTFDYDHDGTISLDELTTVMASCGIYITEDEANDIIKEYGHIDTERGNNLNFEEFLQLMSTKVGGEVKNEILEAFNFFDKDGSGTISADEVKTVMVALGEDLSDMDILDMIREADTKGNGEVCYQDFVKMMTGNA